MGRNNLSKTNNNSEYNSGKPEKESLLKRWNIIVSSKKNDTADVIQKSMGVFGRWHFWVCIAISLVRCPVAWHQLSIVIESPATSFTCADNGTDKCSPNCSSHVFDRSLFTESIITQWDLVCENAYLSNMVQTVTMFGILVGNVLIGFWSDRTGRRNPMVAAVLVQVLAGIAAAFVPWFWAYLVLRFILAVATGGTMITSFVLVMELVGTKWRTAVATLYQLPFSLGHLTLAGLGYYIRDWRYFQLAISVPSVVLLSYYWILPESPRWLLAVGKTDRAVKILEKAAHHNSLPTENIKQNVAKYQQKKDDTTTAGGNILDLVRTHNMRVKTFCTSFNWFVCGLCFYGVAQYIGQLGGNMFINIAVSAAIQIPGTLITVWALDKLGRRNTLIIANVIAGLSCLCILLVDEKSWLKPTFAIISMFGLSISFPSVYVYSGELFPTVVRNVGLGTSSMFARIGSVIAPHVSTLGNYTASWLSPVIFGIAPLLGAILFIWLPETANSKLSDTIEEAEAFAKKKLKLAPETEMQHVNGNVKKNVNGSYVK